MAKIGNNRSSATPNTSSEPIENERSKTRKSDGSTRDKAVYETEEVKYKWDVTTDKVGDRRGSVGGGLNTGANEVYGKIDFNEKTGRAGLTVSNEHTVNDNLSVRGEVSKDNKGKLAGGVGARLGNELGYLDAEVNANAKSKLKGGTIAGRYDVTEDTTLRFRYSDTNKRKATGYIGASHNFEDAGRADFEIGRNTTRGRYAKASYTGDERGKLKVELNEKKDNKLSFEGEQKIGNLHLNERVHVTGNDLDASASIYNTETGHADDLNLSLSGEKGARDIRADWTAARDFGTTRTFYRKSDTGVHTGGADLSLNVTESDRALVGGEVNSDGYAKGYVGSEHDITKNYTVGNTWGVDTDGVRHYAHWIDSQTDDARTRARIKVDHSTDGRKSFTGSASHLDSGDRDHTLNVRLDADGSGLTGKEMEYVQDRPDGLKGSVALGEDGEQFYGRVGLTKELEDGDRQTFNLSFSEDGNIEAEGRVTHNVGDDVEMHAGVRKSRYGGATVSAGVTTDLGEDDDYNLSMGITANTKNEKFAGNIGVRRRASDDHMGVGAKLGLSTDKRKSKLSFGGDISTKNLFGIDNLGGSLGLDTSIEHSKKVEVKTGRGEIGRLRDEVLEGAPEGAKFVRYGMKSKAKADVGVKIPVGAFYVDGGFKRGNDYQVEFVKLEGNPELGKSPDKEELTIPGTASDLMKMKAGESVTITGTSTHGFNGGGGVGASLGDIGPVGFGATAGIKASYAVTGKTKTHVTRGGDSSARIVVSADEDKTKTKGVDVSIGFDADLPLDKIGPAGEVVNGVVNTVLNSWLGFGVKKGTETIKGDERLFDARVDLSKEGTHEAYEKALKGDYSALETLAASDESAVKVEKSIISEIDEKVTPTALRGLGISLEKESRERLKSSDVSTKSGDFEVTSDLDSNTREKDGWIKDTKFTVRDYTRNIEAKEGSELGRYKAEEHYLEINTSNSDAFTSKEELKERLSLASYLLGDDNKDLKKFNKKLDKLKNHRKMWIGPRNELRGTKVDTKVTFCDGALDAFSGVQEDQVWAALAKAEKHFNPDKPAPLWGDPNKRLAIDAGLATETSGVFHGSQLTKSAKNVFAKFELNEKRELVKRLVMIGTIPNEEKRNDLLRETLAQNPGDPTLIGAIADLVGRDKLDVSVKVDSDAGRGGKTYDLSLREKGEHFKLQKTVFGADL